MKILIVDDEKDCLNDLNDALSSTGFESDKTQDSDFAVDLFREKRHDVVLTDYKMPAKNGIELLKQVKQINPEAKVIIMTAYGDYNTAVESLNNKAYAFFSKPINFEQLVNILRNIENDLKNSMKSKYNFQKLSIAYKDLKYAYENLLEKLIKNSIKAS